MRKVKVFKYVQVEGKSYFDMADNGTAMFHAWGSDYEDSEFGVSNFFTAIIERDDGTIENVPVEMIQFLEPEKKS